jgi:hypothetical protein
VPEDLALAIKPLEVLQLMNIIPVITLFGGLAAFFTLAVALRYTAGKTQTIAKRNENQLTG